MPFSYSNAEYADIIFIYGFCNRKSRAAVEEYRRRFPDRRIPNHQTFTSVFRFTREHGKFPTSVRAERPVRQAVEEENNILDLVEHNKKISTRRMAAMTGVPYLRIWKTLKRERFHSFHIQLVQRLEPGDEIHRMAFSRWILGRPRDISRILWTDEAQFTRDGVHNTRNDHVWATENPHHTRVSHSQHRFSVNVWCGIKHNQLLGPYFFEGHLTGEVYLNFLQNELPVLLRGINRRGMILQHDGAPPHYTLAVRNHLSDEFQDRWIGRGGPYAWPPRSPDLTPLDYFLWGYLKSMVYEEEILTRAQLIHRISSACEEIRQNPNCLRRSVNQVTIRARIAGKQMDAIWSTCYNIK